MKRRVLRVLALIILLPVVVVGTTIGHVMLVSRTAPETFDDLSDDLDHLVPSLMEEHVVPGVAMAPSPRRPGRLGTGLRRS